MAIEEDDTGGVISYKNPHALIAYYFAIFSLIPSIGPVVALPAPILGIIGLKRRKTNPVIKGAVHAWIGIVLGTLTSLLWGGMIVLLLTSVAAATE